MKLLFDHCTPAPLRRRLRAHEIVLAEEMAWNELANGALLRAAEAAGFEGMISCDQNLRYQQSLSGRKLAILVIRTNHWPTIRRCIVEVINAVDDLRAGEYREVL